MQALLSIHPFTLLLLLLFFSPSTLANKGGGPSGWLGTCAEVNPNRGAMATGHGLGSVSPWGVSEGTQGSSLRKRKQMAAGIAPPMDCTCSPPPDTPPSAPIQPVSGEPSGGFEVEECLNGGLVCTASDHKARADSRTTLHISLTQTDKHISCLRPDLLHCCAPTNIWLPVGKRNVWGTHEINSHKKASEKQLQWDWFF